MTFADDTEIYRVDSFNEIHAQYIIIVIRYKLQICFNKNIV